MISPAVEVVGLDHDYAGADSPNRILQNIHLEVTRGETLAMLGASGSGKSTLLNLIGGLEPLQSGDIRLFGDSLAEMDDQTRTLLRRETIGFVHQAFNLISTLSVADNIVLPLALAGVPAAQRKQRQEALLEAVGLAGRGSDWPDRLSGGEQQRVAIARALAPQPPLILADEPTGNLDAESGRRVMQLLTGLVAEHGATLLVVTHSLEVAGFSDRVFALQTDGLIPVDADASHADASRADASRTAGAW